MKDRVDREDRISDIGEKWLRENDPFYGDTGKSGYHTMDRTNKVRRIEKPLQCFDLQEDEHAPDKPKKKQVKYKNEQQRALKEIYSQEAEHQETKINDIIDITKALEAIPEKQNKCLLLWAAGFKYIEIAEKLGVSVRTVQRFMSEGQENIRTFLDVKKSDYVYKKPPARKRTRR